MTARRLGATLFGAFVAFWIARAIFKWLLDFDGTAYIAIVAAAMVLGAAAGLAIELDEERKAQRPPSR